MSTKLLIPAGEIDTTDPGDTTVIFYHPTALFLTLFSAQGNYNNVIFLPIWFMACPPHHTMAAFILISPLGR